MPLTSYKPATGNRQLATWLRSSHIDVLQLRVVLERMRAELPPDARLLEPAKWRRDPHRRVRVHRQRAALHGTRHPHGARPVASPDRAGEAVDRVVGEPDSLL